MKDIVVVGGGTAGWSCAALISSNPKLNVTVIEPSDISTIGVGESTIPYMNLIHHKMGFDIFKTPDWLKEVNGTLKFSIEFADYHEIGHKWIHPFMSKKSLDYTMSEKAIAGKINFKAYYENQPDFVNDNFVLPNLRSQQFTHYYEQNNYNFTDLVGYHIDAVLYANLLKRESLKRDNCNYIDSSVQDINVKDEVVQNIILKNGMSISADLFVDCTGFKALLAEAVNSKWDDSYSERLFVDTALAVQLPYIRPKTQKRNTTYCHALGYGWVWNVPLQNRIGTGYVFSSKHTTVEEATVEFKEHLRDKYGYRDNIELRTVPFKVGKRPEGWKNNVVSVGLSNFFLEPIESTAIAQLQHQADTILDMCTATWIPAHKKAERFNRLNNLSLDAIASYIEMHYIFSNRRDTQFWKEFTNLELTDIQKELVNTFTDPSEKFDVNALTKDKYQGHSLFADSSYMFLFLGFDIMPNNKINPELVS